MWRTISPAEAQGVLAQVAAGKEISGLQRDAILYVDDRALLHMPAIGAALLRCPRAAHGVRAEFAAVARQVRALVGAPAPCQLCGGAGWLSATSSEAREAAVMALTFGAWRGAPIPRLESGEPLRGVREALAAMGGGSCGNRQGR